MFRQQQPFTQMPQMPNGMMQQGQMMPQGGQMGMNQQMNGHQNEHDKKDFCKKHMYYFVVIETNDGQTLEGIIDDMDSENVYLLMPVGEDEEGDRQYGYGGYGYGYGYPRRFRRFRRYYYPFFGVRRFFFPFFY
ncbi:hypothetical protein N781_14140 [Pontibacillus halophilus JSM 076056 = DSM 19796]|uniref:Uncharacterized protein n=1 Tax=Pontibacillus halophilus JSM 076056 = DSM 19796 TaxID=1385510 RepID=A0A0A5IB22_9BACI|nr:hypothetical protein [Pontibacillus halophilus]KGX93007.1 hypothetical protein N781_14140 [Pontibacillus halophilus JSM 076056 = DSM 19796]